MGCRDLIILLLYYLINLYIWRWQELRDLLLNSKLYKGCALKLDSSFLYVRFEMDLGKG